MKRLAVLATLLLSTQAGAAQCDVGFFKVATGAKYAEALAAVRKDCAPGSPVIWPSDYTALIAATCDMRKAVIHSGSTTICTLNKG